MNAPLNSDPQHFSPSETGRATAPSSYSPSVPISVYRELATELKTTQTTLDALTQQNQQLLRQNKLLRSEIERFVRSAEQLGHFAGVMPQEKAAPPQNFSAEDYIPDLSTPSDLFAQEFAAPEAPPRPYPEEPASSSPKSSSADSIPRSEAPAEAPPPRKPGARANGAIVPRPKAKKRDRPNADTFDRNKYKLFTEQQEGMRPLSKVASRSDLGNLWLATTILLVVVSAFGAGFLIMRPLLNR